MSYLDFLYLILAFCALALVGISAYLTYNLIQTLNILRRVLINIEGTTKDVEMLKDSLKVGVLSLINKFLDKRMGGENNGKKEKK